jgi:hypothetical protein
MFLLESLLSPKSSIICFTNAIRGKKRGQRWVLMTLTILMKNHKEFKASTSRMVEAGTSTRMNLTLMLIKKVMYSFWTHLRLVNAFLDSIWIRSLAGLVSTPFMKLKKSPTMAIF